MTTQIREFELDNFKNNIDDIPEFRSWLSGVLHQVPVTVTFLKKDGSERTMLCTLQEDKVVYGEKKTDRTKTVNHDTLPVFDMNKNEWRSFRLDHVTRVEFEL